MTTRTPAARPLIGPGCGPPPWAWSAAPRWCWSHHPLRHMRTIPIRRGPLARWHRWALRIRPCRVPGSRARRHDPDRQRRRPGRPRHLRPGRVAGPHRSGRRRHPLRLLHAGSALQPDQPLLAEPAGVRLQQFRLPRLRRRQRPHHQNGSTYTWGRSGLLTYPVPTCRPTTPAATSPASPPTTNSSPATSSSNSTVPIPPSRRATTAMPSSIWARVR